VGKKIKLSAVVWKEDKWYVAVCPHPHVASQGRTAKSALKNLREAVELYLADDVGELRHFAVPKAVCSSIEVELPAL